MQILKIVIIIADNNDLIDILIMDILCPNRITNQYSIYSKKSNLIVVESALLPILPCLNSKGHFFKILYSIC